MPTMKKRNTFVIALAALVAIITLCAPQRSVAGDITQILEPTPAELPFLEFQTSVFGGYNFGDDNAWGAGAGINVFFLEDIGIGLDYTAFDGPNRTSHNVTGSLIYRITNDTLEPYFYGGGGFRATDAVHGTLHVGAGVNLWLTDTVALFTDGRYTWDVSSSSSGSVPFGDYPSITAGLRISF